jgi:hypothetical protein
MIFRSEIKNKSLGEIDGLFSLPTSVNVKRNMKQHAQVILELSRLRLQKFFSPELYKYMVDVLNI